MANIVIYPKNIYSKPKYALTKNNIIKNPQIDYGRLVTNNLNYTTSSDFTVLNPNADGTLITTPIAGQTWYLNDYEDNGVIPYRHFYFKNGENLYYNYAIIKWTITSDDNSFFSVNKKVSIEGDKKTLLPSSFIGGKLVGFYKEFDIDELEITYANRNEYYTFDSNTNEGTFAFKYINYNDHIDFYMVLGLTYSNTSYSNEEINYGFNFTISNIITSGNKYINDKYDNSINSDYTLDTNELISYNVARTILNNVVKKYKEGRKSVTVSVYADNYYDENGVLIYDKTNGDLVRNGDIIKLYEYRNGGYTIVGGNTVRYKVTSSEFEYKGQPIIHLELLEEK